MQEATHDHVLLGPRFKVDDDYTDMGEYDSWVGFSEFVP